MKNSIITRVVILGTIAIFGIIAMQTYWVLSTWNINEAEFNKKVHLALYNVARSLSELSGTTLPARNIIRQRTTNYYEVNIADEIDTQNLEYFLQRELEALALNIDFEYAVFDCHTDEMVYGNYCSYSHDKKVDVEISKFPNYQEFTYYFGVKFPTRSGFLFSKMQLSLILSVILMVTVVFFTYSMFVILRQKRLSEMQKDFINNMTHEFKTPISTIKISADVFLSNPQVQENQRLLQYANIIKDQNQRLNNQVENVLQLARIERGNFALKLERIDLQEFLQDIVSSVSVQIEKMGGQLTTQFSEDQIFIKADRLHLSNVLYNLLDNATKYCRKAPEVTLISKKEGQQVRITIADQGIGIPKEQQSRVFEKFYRVPTGNVHDVKGFGLGLFYVKTICQKHGWKIKLESEEGKCTRINICMPIEK
ncbi:MAG: HAMP domain-containing histidine kinase [Saprospiraceae bacterium]|nr:HAMP domain-containing histidine kinase [Saprospiraceae bacterium]